MPDTKTVTPRSDKLVEYIAKVMAQYLEGAITSPEVVLNLACELNNWVEEAAAENEALTKQFEAESGYKSCKVFGHSFHETTSKCHYCDEAR